MAPVARIARADLPNTPEFRPLRMPRGRITPEKLAAAGSGMAQAAARYTDTFVAAGLSPDFVAQLNRRRGRYAELPRRTHANQR
jgi:alkanesulfonate monooxygenase SsuD/methylene tetrahydromethanopterin reductase-like flavin-dependent oxidoreductase (luciferase family)